MTDGPCQEFGEIHTRIMPIIARDRRPFGSPSCSTGKIEPNGTILPTETEILALIFTSQDSPEQGVTLLVPSAQGFAATWTDFAPNKANQGGVGQELWTKIPD